MAHEITLWTICTHETTGDRWEFVAPPEIRPISFGKGETVLRQEAPRYVLSEWLKGGRIIRWLIANDVKAVVMLGYNDVGRLRIIRWCHRNNIPLFLWGDSNIYGDRATGWKAKIKKRLVGGVLRSCAGLFPCGDCGKAFFAKYGGDDRPMFYHPVEPDYDLIFNLSSEVIEKTRGQFHLATNRRRIIFSGRLDPAKRPDLVLESFLAIADRRPEWDLVIAGDGVLRDELMARVPQHLGGRITWTGFINDQSVVSALYKLCDILVLPSDYEPWGLVVNEAAAAGLAMVCSSCVGAAFELLRDGRNGRIFAAGDLAELTECLLDVADRENIDRMKAASPLVLNRWRARGDPIEGLRKALRSCGVTH